MNAVEKMRSDFNGMFDVFGGYSLALHLGLAIGCLMFLIAFVVTIAKFRGQSNAAMMSSVRDLLLAAGCFITVLAAPVGLFFMGRAFWTATMVKA